MKKVLILSLGGELEIGGFESQIGNAAIFIPLIQLMHQHIPDVQIETTIQFTDEFCEINSIKRAPFHRIVLRYGTILQFINSFMNLIRTRVWRIIRNLTGIDLAILVAGPKLNGFRESDLVVDLNGDIFPSDMHNPIRVLRHVCDLRCVANMGIPLIEFASSPGPFDTIFRTMVSKLAFNRMSAIINREEKSFELLKGIGIKTPVLSTACPAFMLEPASPERGLDLLASEGVARNGKPLIGISVCGYNFPGRNWRIKDDSLLEAWMPSLLYFTRELNASIFFLPHANYNNRYIGIYEPVHGPDYEISVKMMRRLKSLHPEARVKVIERIYSPKDTKSMIGQADIYFSGRMHAGVGAMSQSVPTVLVAYGHKHIGISRLVGQEEFVFQGGSPYELRDLAQRLWENRNRCREVIKNRMPHVESLLHLSFEMLREATSLEKTQMGKIPDNVIEKWQKEIEDVKNDQRLVLPVY